MSEIVEYVVSLWCHDHDHSRDICSRLVHENEVSTVTAQCDIFVKTNALDRKIRDLRKEGITRNEISAAYSEVRLR